MFIFFFFTLLLPAWCIVRIWGKCPSQFLLMPKKTNNVLWLIIIYSDYANTKQKSCKWAVFGVVVYLCDIKHFNIQHDTSILFNHWHVWFKVLIYQVHLCFLNSHLSVAPLLFCFFQDLLRCRVLTSGIFETRFQIDKVNFQWVKTSFISLAVRWTVSSQHITSNKW